MAAIEKVVDRKNLELDTLNGWEVVERYEADEVFLTSDEIANPEYGVQNNTYCVKTIQVTKTRLGKISLFRLRKSGDTIVAEMAGQISQLEARSASLSNDFYAKDEEIAKLKKDLVEQTRLRNDAVNNYTSECARRSQIEQIKRQLEGDIGKIRAHIGKKTMDEILPPPPPKI